MKIMTVATTTTIVLLLLLLLLVQRNVVGELMFSLTYLSSAERLTVVMTKARNLRHPDETKTSSASASKNHAILISMSLP